MFTFAYPGLLYLLLFIPFLIGIYILSRNRRRRKIAQIGNIETLRQLMPDASKYKANIRLILCLIALAAIIFALARPWGGVNSRETSKEGIEIVIAVDASNSMLASVNGEENGTNRMLMAKLILEKLINRLSNDKVGLITFAGDAYTLIPVTNDYISAKAFLNSIDPSMIANQGTNIGAAINLATNSFSIDGDTGKAIILLTDADELEDGAGVIKEVTNASKRGIQTDVIGIGSVAVTIPDNNGGRMIDHETGEVVRTSLNEDLAIEISKAGKGIYVNASNDDAVNELMKKLGTLKKSALQSSFLVSHDELYYPFVILAIALLFIDFIMTDKKNRWLEKISFFHNDKTTLIIVLGGMMSLVSCGKYDERHVNTQNSFDEKQKSDSIRYLYSTENEQILINEGNLFHRSGNFVGADSLYKKVMTEKPGSLIASFNSGINIIRTLMDKEMNSTQEEIENDTTSNVLIQEAYGYLEKAALPKIEKGNLSTQAYYNLGNISFIKKEYVKSIDQYKEALRLNPDDDHARRNLRIAQLQKNDDQQNNENNQQQKQEQDQQQQNQEQQQKRQNINEETSDQILQAAERKENIRRTKMQTEKSEKNPSRKSGKNW